MFCVQQNVHTTCQCDVSALLIAMNDCCRQNTELEHEKQVLRADFTAVAEANVGPLQPLIHTGSHVLAVISAIFTSSQIDQASSQPA